MDFQSGNLHQADEIAHVFDHQIRGRTALLFDLDPVHRGGCRSRRMFLKKPAPCHAVRAADDGQGPTGDLRQHPLRNRGVILGQLGLGDFFLRIEYPIRMGEPHAGYLRLACRCGRFGFPVRPRILSRDRRPICRARSAWVRRRAPGEPVCLRAIPGMKDAAANDRGSNC